MKPIFVLCEGPHDVAFFGRLLKTANVKPYRETLNHYVPKALSAFLIERYRMRDIEGARFRTGRGMVLECPPIFEAAYTLTDPSRLLLFHSCNGDNHLKAIGKFLSNLTELARAGAADVGLPSFGVLFVRDADDRGIDARVDQLRAEFTEILKPVLPSIDQLTANDPDKIVRDGDFSAGCCIFSAPDKNTGTLEDIVWPLLQPWMPPRMDEARQYVDTHGVADTAVARGQNPAAKRLKAALTIAGQMDAPGYALSVVMRDTPAFNDEAIRGNSVCQMLTRMVLEI